MLIGGQVASGSERQYVTILADGKRCAVFSAEVTTRGDLLIFLPTGGRYIDLDGNETQLDGGVIKQQRYSVHPSPSMPDMNMIKHTVEANDKIFTTEHFTRALKINSCFAMILLRIARPTIPELKEKPKGRVHTLNPFEPSSFSLYYCILVSQAERTFTYDTAAYFNIFDLVAGDFRVTVLYGFLSVPAYRGVTAHFLTLDPRMTQGELTQEQLNAVMEGVNEGQAVALFSEIGQSLASRMIQDIKREIDWEPEELEILDVADLYPEGTQGSASWLAVRDALRKLQSKGS
jgi:hypothetical protein